MKIFENSCVFDSNSFLKLSGNGFLEIKFMCACPHILRRNVTEFVYQRKICHTFTQRLITVSTCTD